MVEYVTSSIEHSNAIIYSVNIEMWSPNVWRNML